MEIRRSENRDIPGLIALLKQVGQVHHEIRPDLFRWGAQKYDEDALAQLLADENRPIFVAVEDNTVLGYAFCVHNAWEDHGVFADRRELYVDDICVEESCRGRGVASALFEYVKAYAKDRDMDYITLNVWHGNDAAMRFYGKAGMTPRSMTMEMKLC